MIKVLAKDQFVDALHDEEMRLKICQSWPSTLNQALEALLELESFELASRRGPRVAREAVLEDKEPDSNEPGQTAMHQLMELVRHTQKDSQREQRRTGRQNRHRKTLVCWRCGKNGHMQWDCRQPTLQSSLLVKGCPSLETSSSQAYGGGVELDWVWWSP